ncbi:MAG TPA: CapA family protein [Kofleriaceae bacterium]|nr:CapA family protein [Kofleriaceae bacterium]
MRLFVVTLLIAGCAGDPAPAELWLGGDVHVGARLEGRLAPLAEIVGGAAGVVNLEGPVGAGAEASTERRLVNAPGALAELRAAGVRAVGIANNHAGDLGPAGRVGTERAARAAGLAPVGPTGAVLEVGGVRVVVTAHDLGGGVPPHLAADLAAARARGDALVATFHVTGPPSYLPRPELRAAVDVALAAGARVVSAHGTHAVAAVERRGDAVIAWGLGNLIFACDCSREDEGLILRVSIPRRGRVAAEVVPVDAGLGAAPARPSAQAPLVLELLESLGSSALDRRGRRAAF